VVLSPNFAGELGNDTVADIQDTAVQVLGLSNITAIAAGNSHSMALRNDSTVWVWGSNNFGQLGNDTSGSIYSDTAILVSGLSNIIDIDAAGHYSMALRNDGIVWVWGRNSSGQLGDSTTTQRTTPVQVYGLYNITAISASMALRNDSTVWTWGNSSVGLGDVDTTKFSTIPVQVSGLSNVIAISGYYMALLNDSTIWAWGSNNYGQIGDGTTTDRPIPVQVPNLAGITSIAGNIHSMALKNDSTVWTWGWNQWGGLGNGTTSGSNPNPTPGQMLLNCGVTVPCEPPVAGFGYTDSMLTVNFYDSSENATSWMWDLGVGGIAMGQNPTYTYDSAGTYYVCLTVNSPCGSDVVCDSITLTSTGIVSYDFKNGVTVFPNPNTGEFTLKIDLQKSTRLSINIYQIYGKLIYSNEITNIPGNYIQQLDLSKYAKGMYYVRVLTDTGVVTKKVVYH